MRPSTEPGLPAGLWRAVEMRIARPRSGFRFKMRRLAVPVLTGAAALAAAVFLLWPRPAGQAPLLVSSMASASASGVNQVLDAALVEYQQAIAVLEGDCGGRVARCPRPRWKSWSDVSCRPAGSSGRWALAATRNRACAPSMATRTTCGRCRRWWLPWTGAIDEPRPRTVARRCRQHADGMGRRRPGWRHGDGTGSAPGHRTPRDRLGRRGGRPQPRAQGRASDCRRR